MPIEPRGGQDAKPQVLAKWGSLNTKVDRSAIAEDEFSWVENFYQIAPGNLRTLYAEGTSLYTAPNPRTIILFYPYNLGATAYVAVFLDDGSAIQVQVSNGATMTIGTAGTFYTAGKSLPACSQYQSLYLLIGSDVSSNAYWAWDGSHLFGAGTLSPQVTVVTGGANYSTTPTLTASGGSGTGATFSADIANSQVTDAKCTNGGSGYQLGEKVTLSFSGGGSDTEAQAVGIVATKAMAVAVITVTNGGSGYTSAPSIDLSGLPSQVQATATATVSGGAVTAINVTANGSAYFAPPLVTISGGGGTGATAVAVLRAGLGGFSDQVVSITVTNGGSGYASPPTVTIAVPEVPTLATATVTVTNGKVTAITVTDPGYGYLGPPAVSLSGGGGTGATAVAQMMTGMLSRIDIVTGGSGYAATPAVTISTPDDPLALFPITATAVATINSSNVVSAITLSNRGSGYIKPQVDIRGGNNCAHAEAVLMPFGIQATTIETYNNQVWTTANPAAGPKMSFTAPNSISDFSTFDGGGSAPATDSFLRRALTGMKQDDGFLYRFADSSVNVITNVQTSAAGITTYNNANVDTQIGTIWRDTICSFDRAIVFANSTGVYALFGGAVQKVSDQLDGIFLNASFNTGGSGVTPSATVCTLFGVRCYCLLMTSTDYLGASRNFLCCWDGKKWFIASQTKALKLVGLQEIDSVFTAWGSDGTNLFKLFQTPSTSLTKTLQTRLDGASEPDLTWRVDNVYAIANLRSGVSGTLSLSVDTEAGSGTSQSLALVAGTNIVYGMANPSGATMGTLRGLTGTTTAADLSLVVLERLESQYSRKQ